MPSETSSRKAGASSSATSTGTSSYNPKERRLLDTKTGSRHYLETNPNIIDEIIKRTASGESVKSLCKEFGVSRNSVYSLCKRRGQPIRSKWVVKPFKFDVAIRRLIAKEYGAGASSNDVASKYNCSHKTVTKCAREFGVKIRDVDDNRNRRGDPRVNTIRSAYRRSGAAKRYGFSLTDNEFNAMLSLPCFYCGLEPSQKRLLNGAEPLLYSGIDRIDSTNGYHSGNVVPACFRCNSAKNNMSLSEFRDWIVRLVDNSVLDKIKGLVE